MRTFAPVQRTLNKPKSEVRSSALLQRTAGTHRDQVAASGSFGHDFSRIPVSSPTKTDLAVERVQETDCYFELIVEKVVYCFNLYPLADKPGRWRITAVPAKPTSDGKAPVEYSTEIKIELVKGKHYTKPTGTFKMCPTDPLIDKPCIFVDEVSFTRNLDTRGPKFTPQKN